MNIKDKVKHMLLQRLHCVDAQKFDIANALSVEGTKNFFGLDFFRLKSEILKYVSVQEVAPFAYKYSSSRTSPCLYGSIYAVMIKGLFGELDCHSDSYKKEWAEYLNSFQNPEDGLYYDPVLVGDTYDHKGDWNEGWGKHHLMGHIIIALARLGYTPKYPLKYLDSYYDVGHLTKWMNGFDFSNEVWSTSNYFMNLYTVLEYARDYMGESRAQRSIEIMIRWLLEKQNNDTGMWHDGEISRLDRLGKLNVVRAAYHFYPLFVYEEISIPYAEKIIETILPLQNSWGGWTVEFGNSGACEDIDAIEPMIRCAYACPEKRPEIEMAIRKSMVWQLACRNCDGGFSFYLRAQQEYGGHPATTSLRDESSMFATWFRTLCLAYEMKFLEIPNDFNLGKYPGYEIAL